MRSGGPWQVRGVRQRARDTAREAARRSGLSVGEWLDTVILDKALEEGVTSRWIDPAYDDWDRDDGAPPARLHKVGDDEPGQAGPDASDEVLNSLNARLDVLTKQLERIARANAARSLAGEKTPGAVAPVARQSRDAHATPSEVSPSPVIAASPTPAKPTPATAPLDQALAEIAERQRALENELAAPRSELQHAPTQALSGLEQQLREITERMTALRPCAVEGAVETLRDDLAEIGVMIKEAMPRDAMVALEAEVRALAERVQDKRDAGIDSAVLAGVERGLAEVRDTLRAFTPAEGLIGYDEAVRTLSQKIDRIAVSPDPTALEQLEGSIVALKDIVSRSASHDALARLSEEVRALDIKIERVANSGSFAALERRIATLTDALQAHDRPDQDARQLEAVIRRLTEKLERLAIGPADQAAVALLEDRIARLVEKLDASDAKLSHLETIERGLTELLHLEHQRTAETGRADVAPDADTLQRDMTRTQDALEAVHGALGHMVDRLAMIETGLRENAVPRIAAVSGPLPPAARTDAAADARAAAAGATATVAERERRPFDPNLPPDHPLEPGVLRARTASSAAERIAASQAEAGDTKPPAVADPAGKSNFIAAARRAAQAAAAAAAEAPGAKRPGGPSSAPQSAVRAIGTQVSKHVRVVLVGGSAAALIALGSVYVATTWLGAPNEATTVIAAQPALREVAPSEPAPMILSAPTARPPALLPNNAGAPFGAPPAGQVFPPEPSQSTSPEANPDNITTGSIQGPAIAATPPADPGPGPQPANAADKLPAALGSAALRVAALEGDPNAQYEIAMRYAEGRGIAQNLPAAAEWLERAAKQGLVPALFRLGGFYEKGMGVKKNLNAARRLYTAAAEAGNAKAMHNLAVLYAEGIDGRPDYQTATTWFRKGASHGVHDSQYNLGILYARGIGVETNLAEAYKWFALAARDGDAEAAKKRDDVAARLDPQTRAAANAAVQAWTVEPQPEAATQVKAPPGGWDAPTAPAAKRRTSAK